MSRHVKSLMEGEVSKRLEGVDDALLVNVVGLDANKTMSLRRELRAKDIQLMVVRNSLAQRATKDTPLAAAFQQADGPLALVWGSEDVVSLAKEVVRLAGERELQAFEPRGGVMDGTVLDAEQVREVSKWPSRDEQLSLLVGQILGPGAHLTAQLCGPGGALVSQIKQKGEEE